MSIKELFTLIGNRVMPIANGGHGATTLDGAKQNLDIPLLARGSVTFASTATGATRDTAISFNMTFPSVPTVIVGFATSGTAARGSMSVSAINATITGATIRLMNDSGSAATPDVNWIAILIP